MTIRVRIERKPAIADLHGITPAYWAIRLTSTDEASTMAFDAASLVINNANGKFRLHAKGVDGTHLAAMADIIIGPEHPANYAEINLGAVE